MANSLTGTYSVDDLLAVRLASAANFGTDKIFNALQADMDFYNGLVREQLSLMAENVTEQTRIYGGSNLHRMTQVDEFGVAPSKKAYVTSDVSFPLNLFSSTIGWTSKFIETAKPAEYASEYLAVRGGHSYEINLQIKKAIYNNTNYSFVDKLTNGVTLNIKRFVNADSAAIPDYQGTTFDGSTHTHYVASTSGSVANDDVDALISNVTEHGHTRGLMLVIALADKAKIKALTGFTALGNIAMDYRNTDTTKAMLDNTDLNNQHIGYWGDVQIWVKPYAVANYMLCITTEGEKALGFREREQTSLQGLRLVSDIPTFPLIAKSFEAEFGIAVNNRTAGAVLQLNSSTWANPTIS